MMKVRLAPVSSQAMVAKCSLTSDFHDPSLNNLVSCCKVAYEAVLVSILGTAQVTLELFDSSV